MAFLSMGEFMNKKCFFIFLLGILLSHYVSLQENDFIVYEIFVGKVKHLSITGYSGTETELNIPSHINGLPVGIIEEKAFFQRQLTSVIIPDTVIRIFRDAFLGNNLASVIIPNRVDYIGRFAFAHNQLADIILPNSLREIKMGAFTGNKLTTLVIPNRVVIIESLAFAYNHLSNVVIPQSVTKIEDEAFSNNQLTDIVIPNSVVSIGVGAFKDNQLTTITIGANVILEQAQKWGTLPFGNGFDEFYLTNGSKAGTYVFMNGIWSMQE